MTSPTVRAAVRRFNRRWTEQVGLLDRHLLDSALTLPEARVVYELAHHTWERAALRARLGIDPSQLTRVLHALTRHGLVTVKPSPADRRARIVSLTDAGREMFAELDRRSDAQVDALLAAVAPAAQRSLTEAMALIAAVLPGDGDRPVAVRHLAPGDLGWIVQRHGELYATEYAWDTSFEALVARIVADFAASFRPGLEQAWIAEVDGVRAGCVLCCHRDQRTAQLRVLLVEPWARGLGIGRRLVADCVEFARGAGYEEIVLWTNDVLVAARRIYVAAGFTLVEEEAHRSFGHDLVGQLWSLPLR